MRALLERTVLAATTCTRRSNAGGADRRPVRRGCLAPPTRSSQPHRACVGHDCRRRQNPLSAAHVRWSASAARTNAPPETVLTLLHAARTSPSVTGIHFHRSRSSSQRRALRPVPGSTSTWTRPAIYRSHYPSWGLETRRCRPTRRSRAASHYPSWGLETGNRSSRRSPQSSWTHYPSWGLETGTDQAADLRRVHGLITPHGDWKRGSDSSWRSTSRRPHYPSWGLETRSKAAASGDGLVSSLPLMGIGNSI